MYNETIKVTKLIELKDRFSFSLANNEKIYLSPSVQMLNEKYDFETFFTRIIKHQQNWVIKKQVIQIWSLNRSVKKEIMLSIKDRYDDYLVYESYLGYEKLPSMQFYLIEGMLYVPEELN